MICSVLSNVADFNGSVFVSYQYSPCAISQKGNHQVSSKKKICNNVHIGSLLH